MRVGLATAGNNYDMKVFLSLRVLRLRFDTPNLHEDGGRSNKKAHLSMSLWV